MKLTKEDIIKYGTRDEIEFLLEGLLAQMANKIPEIEKAKIITDSMSDTDVRKALEKFMGIRLQTTYPDTVNYIKAQLNKRGNTGSRIEDALPRPLQGHNPFPIR
jgi:hypothetical protein